MAPGSSSLLALPGRILRFVAPRGRPRWWDKRCPLGESISLSSAMKEFPFLQAHSFIAIIPAPGQDRTFPSVFLRQVALALFYIFILFINFNYV